MNKTATSLTDGVAKKRPARLLGKRAHSVSPLRPLQASDLAKKGNRRCASLTPPDFSKGEIGKVTYPPSANPSQPSLPECGNGSELGVKTLGPVSPTALVKLQRLLTNKKREFLKLRKQFIPEQKTLIEMYASIRDLEHRIGCPTESVGDLRVISVTSWPPHDLLMLIRDDLQFPNNSDISGIFGPQILQQLFAQLSAVPDEVLQMGAELMAKRIDILNLLRKSRSERAYTNNQEQKTRNAEQDQETERLHRVVAGTADNIKAKINYSLELAKVPWLDRERFLKKIDRLQKDNLILQHKLEEAEENHVTQEIPVQPMGDVQLSLQEELAKERSAREASKEMVAVAESMLRVARARISSLERQLKESKADLDAAHRKHKELEQLHRHRETSYDTRSKKLLEVSKTGEITIEALSRQRDALETRVKELRDQLEVSERQRESRDAEQRSKTESLQSKLAEQEKKNKEAERRVAELESKGKEMEELIRNLRERSGALVDMERKRCLEYLPQKESEPSERETELWKELQAVRLHLSRAEEELRQSRADKENFLVSLSKIAQEGAEHLQEKMAIELLEKERKILSLQQMIEELRENEKLMEQTMTQYEDQLASLRIEVKRLRNYECYPKEDRTFQELETELLEMNMRVEELSRERTALVSAAASRALMLERHERAADLFARVTRARRELAAVVDGQRDPPAAPTRDLPEACRSLSSVCVSAMETWSALRAERARVLRLEGAVLAQALALEREGRARTRLEHRRALLERELLRAHSAHSAACETSYTKHFFF